MAKNIITRPDGTKFRILSPSEKGKKAAHELKTGKRVTNMNEPKRGRNGQQLKVTKQGRAYRHGYLDARKDIGQAAKAVRSKKKRHITKGAYNSRGKVNEALIDDLRGPVVFFDPDFEFTSTGRIKGQYNANGRFEPD